MIAPEALVLAVFALATVACLLSGYPVAFGLGGAGVLVVGGLVLAAQVGLTIDGSDGWPLIEARDWRDLSPLADDTYQLMSPSGQTLLAIPLFVLMGALLHRSAVAERLLEGMQALTRALPGGLGVAVVLVGGVLAASTGVVGASVAALAVIAFPALRKQGYGPRLSAGIVTASGTLGQVIPPSIILILLAEQVGSQFQAAQIAQGVFAPMAVTSGDLFRAALIPGVLVMVGFALWAMVAGRGVSQRATEDEFDLAEGLSLPDALGGMLPPLGLIVLVLGSIISGLTDTTSAASFGAMGALVLASRSRLLHLTALGLTVAVLLWRVSGSVPVLQPLAVVLFAALLITIGTSSVRAFRTGVLPAALNDALRLTGIIFAIIIGAGLFALSFKALGGDTALRTALMALTTASGATDPAEAARFTLLVLLISIFLLGFVLEFIEIIVVVLPLTLPVVFAVPPEVLDPVWAGVLIALTLQTSFLTPPFGVALFYFRGAAKRDVSTLQLYAGVAPFIAVQVAVIALVWWLPGLI